MSERFSFTKYENELRSVYRDRLNKAESSEDVKKFFVYTVLELFEKIFDQKIKIHYDDITLDPESKPPYRLSRHLQDNPELNLSLEQSDLDVILSRMAQSAANRYMNLIRHAERSDSKISYK